MDKDPLLIILSAKLRAADDPLGYQLLEHTQRHLQRRELEESPEARAEYKELTGRDWKPWKV